MENTKTETINQLMGKVSEDLKLMDKIEYKDIKSFKQLPIYILDSMEKMNNTFRKPLFEFGNKVINNINSNTNPRYICEVEFLCENKTLDNSRLLWLVVEKEDELLQIVELDKDII